MKKKLYMCQNCMAFYEDKERTKNCHEGYIIEYDVNIFNRKSCSGSYRHYFTDKATGKRIDYCYYCNIKKGDV